MKKIKESLIEYSDDIFFTALFESELMEEDEEMSPAEKQKLANEHEKQGMAVVKKCQANWKAFRVAAGKIWQEYRDFWSTQKDANESIGQKGIFYNLYKSEYIVGVVKNASGMAELKVYNTAQQDSDEFETFVCKNPDVINAFNAFFKGEVENTMKEIISSHKEAMAAKKKADKLKAKEDATAAQRAKLDAFLSESVLNERDWAMKLDITDAVQNAIDHDDWTQYRDELVYALESQIDKIQEVLGDEVAMNAEDIIEELKGAENEDSFEWVLGELLHPWAEVNDIFLAQFGEADIEEPKYVNDEEDDEWIDPAGGTHYGDEDDPAAMYQ